ncbi:hypothetical protein, partial [Maricaulis salignorans]
MLEVGGSSEAVLENPRGAPWPSNATHVTNSNWYFTCQGNNTFIGHAPNGQTYRFDRHIVRDAMPGGAFNDGSLNRDTHILAATEVTDQHGNWVRYTYDSSGRLTRIHGNDGRQITLNYSGSSQLVSSASANGRTWTYTYRTSTNTDGTWIPEQYVDGGTILASLTLPDGRAWTFNLDRFQSSTPPSRFCLGMYNLSMTHPSGAQGDFTLRTYALRASYDSRTRQSVMCPFLGAQGPGDPGTGGAYPLVDATAVPVIGIMEKSISGPGLPTATWTYEYEQDTTSGTSLSDPTNWSRVTGPDAVVTFYHRWRDQPEGGAQTRVEVRASAGGPVLEATDTTYIVEARFGDAGPSGLTPIDLSSLPRRTAVQTRNRGGDVYTTDYSYNTNSGSSTYSWGNPVQSLQESNLPGVGQRTTDTEYEHNTSAWILGLPERVVLNGVEFYDVTYDSDGMPTGIDQFGTRVETRSYNGDGTLAWTRDALNRQTSFSSYLRGQPRTITLADSNTIQVAVDNNGWITGVTNARGYTSGYAYNAAGWLTGIDRPSPFADTTIAYTGLGAGIVQTLTTGTVQVTTTHDRLHRPLLVRRQSLTTGGSTYQRTQYDATGRVTFTSLPAATSAAPDGITTQYDSLGRVIETAETVAPYATTLTAYLSGNRTRTTDPMGNITTSTASGYGGPGDGNTVEIAQPMGLTTLMSYDIWGNLLTARQFGSHNGYNVDQTQRYFYDTRFRLCRLSVPENRDTLFGYDNAGQLTGISRGRPVATGCANLTSNFTVDQSWDSRGRLTQIDYPDASPDVDLSYDANGNLVSALRGTTSWTYSYDALDALTGETLALDGRSFASSYTRNANGFITARTSPSGRTINYTPDGFGRATALTIGSSTYASAANYHVNGALTSLSYGNGRQLAIAFNARQLMSDMVVNGGGTLIDLDYSHDANARITTITDHVQASQTRGFGYDGLGRLITASGPWGSGSFDYDPLNNLRGQTLGSRTVEVDYNSLNRVKRVRDSDTGNVWRNYSYDNRGNTASNGQLNWTYDRSEQPVAISGSNSGDFVYDAHRRRVRQTINGETVYSVYDAAGTLVFRNNVTNGETNDFLRLAGRTVVRLSETSSGTAAFFTHGDHLGSPLAATTSSGGLLWREDYTPFGEARQQPVANEEGDSFTGHITDTDTGMVYM